MPPVPNLRLTLVGGGSTRAQLAQQAGELGLEDRIEFVGEVPDVLPYLQKADVFVLPSLYEGMPYTLMEAMAAGRAVVATDVAGNRDLVRHGETGLLVPPGQARGLASAILSLVSAPDVRARLGMAAQAEASKRATPDQMVQQVMELYVSVLGRSRIQR